MTKVRSISARLLSRGAAVGASLCLLALAPVADAAPASPAAPAAGKPSCVTVRHTVGNVTQTVWVANHCPRTVSFVIHRVGADSPCLHAAPGQARGMKWARPYPYEGTTFGCD